MLNDKYFDDIFEFMNNIIKENDLEISNYTLLLDWSNSEASVLISFEPLEIELKDQIGIYGHPINEFAVYPIPYDLLTVSVSFLTEFLTVNPSFLDDTGISCSNHVLYDEMVKSDKIQQQIDDYLLYKAENGY